MVREGLCNGTNEALEAAHQATLNLPAMLEKTGFNLRSPSEVAARQIDFMQVCVQQGIAQFTWPTILACIYQLFGIFSLFPPGRIFRPE